MKRSALTPKFCHTGNIPSGEAIRTNSAILLYLEYLFGRSYPSSLRNSVTPGISFWVKLSVLTPEICYTWNILFDEVIRPHYGVVIPEISIWVKLSFLIPELCHTWNILLVKLSAYSEILGFFYLGFSGDFVHPFGWSYPPSLRSCCTWDIHLGEYILPQSAILSYLKYPFGWSYPSSLRNSVIPGISFWVKLSVLTLELCHTLNILLEEAIRPHSGILSYLEYLFGRSYPSSLRNSAIPGISF